jgi:hypothetical protein
VQVLLTDFDRADDGPHGGRMLSQRRVQKA